MQQVITGDVGRITWGYHLAATTGRFEMRPSQKGEFLLRAQVASSDPFRLRQPGLSFEMTVFNARCAAHPDRSHGHDGCGSVAQSQVWAWPVTSLEVKDGVIVATLKVKGKA